MITLQSVVGVRPIAWLLLLSDIYGIFLHAMCTSSITSAGRLP